MQATALEPESSLIRLTTTLLHSSAEAMPRAWQSLFDRLIDRPQSWFKANSIPPA